MTNVNDTIEKLRNSTIQHGPLNSRIYLMKLHEEDVPDILQDMNRLARDNKYGKILAKVPSTLIHIFAQWGYGQEAAIPGFFRGIDDMVFMAKYFSSDRSLEKNKDRIQDIITIAQKKNTRRVTFNDEESVRIRRCFPLDAREMSLVYQQIFQTYPVPIHDPEYLVDAMKAHCQYFCAIKGEDIIALASSEIDADNLSVEMTDFATLPDWRGRGMALRLLEQMEAEMVQMGMYSAYTIARALSYGMNITFGKMGYIYAGTLTNNTNISGRIESMSLWHKTLKRELPAFKDV